VYSCSCLLGTQAYRALAKVHHPDKGGDGKVFHAIRLAFETLSDPQRRAVYDQWAKELQFRYVPGVASKVTTKLSFNLSFGMCQTSPASLALKILYFTLHTWCFLFSMSPPAVIFLSSPFPCFHYPDSFRFSITCFDFLHRVT
jgi:curved DNA-binding protein CbpA